MPTPIVLTDCLGLIDLMLTGDEHGPTFTRRGAHWSVVGDGCHAYLEVVSPDFRLMMAFPGWYGGKHGLPAYIALTGDALACFEWLPIDPGDKRALIDRMPLSTIDKTLCRLAI